MKVSIPLSFLFLLLWLPLLCAGQSVYQSGRASYGVELEYNYSPTEKQKEKNSIGFEYLQKIMDHAIKIAAGIEATLRFNPEQAKFYAEEQLENDAINGLNHALLSVNLKGDYYYDLTQQKVSMDQEAFGKSYLVERPLKTPADWNITSEKKKIGNYTVYKATTVQVVENSKGIFESAVIAWFAPAIPFSFGPIGYGGLPGLILELEIQSMAPIRYFVKSVDFHKQPWTMEVPENGEHISEEDYNNLFLKAKENLGSF